MLSALRRLGFEFVAVSCGSCRVIDDKTNDSSCARALCDTAARLLPSPEAESREARDAQRSTSFELLMYVNSIYTARLPTKSL